MSGHAKETVYRNFVKTIDSIGLNYNQKVLLINNFLKYQHPTNLKVRNTGQSFMMKLIRKHNFE